MTITSVLKSFITKKLDSAESVIKKSITSVKSNLQGKIAGVGKSITSMQAGIKNTLKTRLDSVGGSLDSLTKTLQLSNPLQGLGGILDSGLMNVFSKMIKSLSDMSGNPFKNMTKSIEAISKIELKTSSAPTMEGLFEWGNEIGSALFGIRPYAVQVGDVNFIDTKKEGVYYKVVQGIVMVFWAFYNFITNFSRFLNYPFDFYVREFYELEKLSIHDYVKLNYMGFIDDGKLKKVGSKVGFNDIEIKRAKNLFWKFLSPMDYMTLHKRGHIDKTKLTEYFKAIGFSNIERANVEKLYTKFLSLTDYIFLNRKGKISDSALTVRASSLGYSVSTKEHLEFITQFHAGARDLIDFAVREAFEPDEKLFIHGANAIPAPFKTEGAKIGLTETDIKRFWHSHWRLLGVGQILDAFHRKLITEAELLDYLRRLDYTENDREILKGLSFNLLTRVDVRRLFENGLMSSSQLFEYYGTLGFSETDKTRMTLLAKQLRFVDMNDLRKQYIEQFENGLLTEKEIRQNLTNTGLDKDEIDLYLQLSESNRELEFKLSLKKQIELRFYEGVLTYNELIDQLRGLGVSNREIERVERNASLYQYRKPRLMTIAELKRYLKNGIIDLQKFVYYALRLGYSTEIIEYILLDIKQHPSQLE